MSASTSTVSVISVTVSTVPPVENVVVPVVATNPIVYVPRHILRQYVEESHSRLKEKQKKGRYALRDI